MSIFVAGLSIATSWRYPLKITTMTEEFELQDSLQPDEELDLEEEQGEQGDDDDIATLKAKNSQLYARLKKLENKKRDNPVREEKPKQKSNASDDKLARLELKVDGFTDEETDFLVQYGGKEALKNPIVKKALDVMRQERIAENAQVDDSSAKSEFERKYSTEDLRGKTVAELEAILPKSE